MVRQNYCFVRYARINFRGYGDVSSVAQNANRIDITENFHVHVFNIAAPMGRGRKSNNYSNAICNILILRIIDNNKAGCVLTRLKYISLGNIPAHISYKDIPVFLIDMILHIPSLGMRPCLEQVEELKPPSPTQRAIPT